MKDTHCEPPSYDKSFLDVKASGSSGPPVRDKKNSGSNLAPVGSASLRTRTSFLSGLRDVFRRGPLSEHDSAPENQIKSTVLDKVRTLVQPYTGSAADRLTLLAQCTQLCARHKLDLSLLLQEKSIHGHTALYWAIVNGPWPPCAPFPLVAAVLAHSAPLKPETVHEVRQACVLVKSQEVLQFLRSRPEFGELSKEDQFLLGGVSPAEVVVEHKDLEEGSTEPFLVKFRIPMFLKRMAHGSDVELEFLARGQLWKLRFFTAVDLTQKKGLWCGTLTLVETGPITHAEFGLVFYDARLSPPSGPRHFQASGGSDTPLEGRGDSNNSETAFSWQIFADDSVCIADDGSVSGVLCTPASLAQVSYRAKWDYTAQEGAMALKKDDLVEFIRLSDNGKWWLAKKNGVEGWVPPASLELVNGPTATLS
ncbi:hypothetical protein K438DRAFT_24140 [Mycena galopus ATCC 62051]|nr:hypothetical protein K438DRAFT_24140 [Mycena galopus ATCC 62051]